MNQKPNELRTRFLSLVFYTSVTLNPSTSPGMLSLLNNTDQGEKHVIKMIADLCPIQWLASLENNLVIACLGARDYVVLQSGTYYKLL